MSIPFIGSRVELHSERHRGFNTIWLTLVREDESAPSTDRYVLRVDDDPRGKFGYAAGDEIAVEAQWFSYRASLWPRHGGIRVHTEEP